MTQQKNNQKPKSEPEFGGIADLLQASVVGFFKLIYLAIVNGPGLIKRIWKSFKKWMSDLKQNEENV